MQVRIRDEELDIIIATFKKHFLAGDHLWLFGSRADMKKRGGDIDFYIETSEIDIDKAIKMEDDFVGELWDRIGEQQIDVVLNILSLKDSLPIYKIAKTTGVRLV